MEEYLLRRVSEYGRLTQNIRGERVNLLPAPKKGSGGGAGKDDHFPKNSAVEFLGPDRAHLPRGIRNFMPNRLDVLLFILENEHPSVCLRKHPFSKGDRGVFYSSHRADKRHKGATDTSPTQGEDVQRASRCRRRR